jgi:hypothetical protein
LVVCVGDDPWDFAFAYALDRLGVDARWMPTRAAGDLSALHAVSNLARRFQRSSELKVRLCSVSAKDALDAFAEGLADELLKVASERCEPRDLIPVAPVRVYERERDVHYRATLVHQDGMTAPLQTPVPMKLAVDSADDIHWMTDIEVEGWKSVCHRSLGERVLSGLAVTEGVVRCGREAISYLCPNVAMLRPDLSLESQTPQPRLAALKLGDQVEALLAPQDWGAEPSDKGIYLRQSAAIFGGTDELVEALSDDRVNALTMFVATGKRAPGVCLDARRYVWLKDLVAAYPDEQEAEAVILGLEDAGALIRGFVLKCQYCRNRRFYRLTDIGEGFQCPRCWTRQAVNQRSLLVRPGAPEPVWRYGLAEVIYQFLFANGDLPLLSAYRFVSARPKRREPFQLVGELDISPPESKTRELDIILTHGSELWLGEATLDNNLGRDEVERLERLARLADMLSARGVLLITSQQWREQTKLRARQTFPGVWPQLTIIEGWHRAQRWMPRAVRSA